MKSKLVRAVATIKTLATLISVGGKPCSANPLQHLGTTGGVEVDAIMPPRTLSPRQYGERLVGNHKYRIWKQKKDRRHRNARGGK